jgi:hypothetical protein
MQAVRCAQLFSVPFFAATGASLSTALSEVLELAGRSRCSRWCKPARAGARAGRKQLLWRQCGCQRGCVGRVGASLSTPARKVLRLGNGKRCDWWLKSAFERLGHQEAPNTHVLGPWTKVGLAWLSVRLTLVAHWHWWHGALQSSQNSLATPEGLTPRARAPPLGAGCLGCQVAWHTRLGQVCPRRAAPALHACTCLRGNKPHRSCARLVRDAAPHSVATQWTSPPKRCVLLCCSQPRPPDHHQA